MDKIYCSYHSFIITLIILEKVQQNKTKVIERFHFIQRQETG